MSSTAYPVVPASLPRYLVRTLAAAAVVGVLDGLAAWLLHVVVLDRTSATRLFQGIARAAIGDGAFEGGAATALLGLLFHFTVALGWTAAYALAHRRSRALRRATSSTSDALLAGVALGVVVWLVMAFVVVPASHIGARPRLSGTFFVTLAIHMLVVGPPITLLVRDRDGRDRDGR